MLNHLPKPYIVYFKSVHLRETSAEVLTTPTQAWSFPTEFCLKRGGTPNHFDNKTPKRIELKGFFFALSFKMYLTIFLLQSCLIIRDYTPNSHKLYNIQLVAHHCTKT